MSLHAQYIEAYYNYHERLRGFRPTLFTGSDLKSIKNIRLRIEKLLTEKTDENSLMIWNKVLQDLPKADKWLSEQPLQTINQRFDTLIFKIKTASEKKIELAKNINEYLNAKYQ